MSRGNLIKVSIIVVAVATCVGVYAFSNREPAPALALDAKSIACICTKCEKPFDISHEVFQSLLDAGSSSAGQNMAGAGRQRSAGSRHVVVTCPVCQEATGRLASHCTTHDIQYAKYTDSGATARCPKCLK